MLKVLLFVLLTIYVSVSAGLLVHRKFKLEINGFVAPLGFASLIACLQILYYPMQLFNLSSYYRDVLTSLVYLGLIVYSFRNLQAMRKLLFKRINLLLIFTSAMFLYVFYQMSITLNFGDAQMYLNYISQNIRNDNVSLFNIWTGKLGTEWDNIYLYQGYYHFISYAAYIINALGSFLNLGGFVENIVIETWGPGLIYSMISSMAIYNIVSSFNFKKAVKWIVLIFTLFFSNYYYWRVAYSFYGNTFRTLYITLLIYYLYLYFRDNIPQYKYVCIIISFAGLAFSSSYLFIAFVVYYCLMVYLFMFKPEDSIAEMADFVLPMLIFVVAYFKNETLLIIAYTIVIVLYFALRKTDSLKLLTAKLEQFLNRNSRLIFMIVIPLLTIVYSFVYKHYNPAYPYDMAHYFTDHQGYDMIKDYFFVYSHTFDNILNLIRWLGVFLLLKQQSENKGFRFLRYMFIITIIMFLNPLNTVFVSKFFASNVYYRSFEVIFNPFTETLFVYLLIGLKNKYLNTVIYGILISAVVLTHAGLFIPGAPIGEALFFEEGKYVDPVFKVEYAEYEVLTAFREIVNNTEFPDDKQVTVVSHAEGTRVFMPEVYQIFTVRQYWYEWDRVDQNFYECARRHYSWMDTPEAYYSEVPNYIEKYEVDFVIVRYEENPEFDKATDECMTTIYSDDTFKIKISDFTH